MEPLRRLGHALLVGVSWGYGAVASWRRRRRRLTRRARTLSVPVISVGNITCGGTGKTPAVEMIARDLLQLGRKPAFLSRGYGGGAQSAGNDEFRVLASNLPDVPHFQGKDRYEQGLKAIAAGADVLILDDGFQHTRLARDLDLVLVDALSPFGGGHVLPAGLLREPLETLAQADVLAITRSNQISTTTLSTLSAYLRNCFPHVPQLYFATQPVSWVRLDGRVESPEALRGRRVLAFCGIGNPEGFRRQLLELGLEIAAFVCFRDHYSYTDADLEKLRRQAKELRAAEVVMTQKDAVKVTGNGFPEWLYLRVEQRRVRGEDAYQEVLERALTPRRGRLGPSDDFPRDDFPHDDFPHDDLTAAGEKR